MKFTNRKIKFRVWTGATMEYRVLAGALGHFYVDGMSKTDSACLSEGNTIYDDATPLMQWTGLVDKNGVEIYEGDIVKFENDEKPYVVSFEKGAFTGVFLSSWGAKNGEYITASYCNDFTNYVIIDKDEKFGNVYELKPVSLVIGNIHQNPELIQS